MSDCNNCGCKSHCGEKCMKSHEDGDGKDIIIECCKNCRCEKC
jgi:hypothetical protein